MGGCGCGSGSGSGAEEEEEVGLGLSLMGLKGGREDWMIPSVNQSCRDLYIDTYKHVSVHMYRHKISLHGWFRLLVPEIKGTYQIRYIRVTHKPMNKSIH